MSKTTKKRYKPRSLITDRVEGISKDVFKRYFSEITSLIGSSPGIYALYDEDQLYYVGKSTDLKKRVKQHLRDRHYASWTHFSWFLIRKVDHINEIESLLIRISNPKGNRIKPKGRAKGDLIKKLKKMVKDSQRTEYEKMFPQKKTANRGAGKKAVATRKKIKGLVSRKTTLYRSYKGKEYKALLFPTGVIKIGKNKYSSPTAAALKIVDGPTVNGWNFWYIKDSNGEWVKLSEFRG
jgi:hypothetical protein